MTDLQAFVIVIGIILLGGVVLWMILRANGTIGPISGVAARSIDLDRKIQIPKTDHSRSDIRQDQQIARATERSKRAKAESIRIADTMREYERLRNG